MCIYKCMPLETNYLFFYWWQKYCVQINYGLIFDVYAKANKQTKKCLLKIPKSMVINTC